MGLAEKHGIDVSPVPGGIVMAAHVPQAMARLQKRHDYWQSKSEPSDLLNRKQIAEVLGTDIYAGALIERRGIAINPLAWVRGLARAAIASGAQLFEKSNVTALERVGDGWIVKTPGGNARAGDVLICTNAYSGDIWPGLRQTFIAVRGYQVWSKPLDTADRGKILRGVSALLETRRLPVGIRLNNDGRLIFGGGNPGLGAEKHPDLERHRRLIGEMFPGIKPIEIEGWWSGWVTRGISDGWRIHRLAPNLLTAAACNGRGVAMGPAMGRELARLVLGARDDELLIPITKPARLAGYPFHRFVVPVVMGAMRWKDRRELKAAARQPKT
ncbi:MAG: FAD-binding oxidoreductase [Pararhodobacter sp.]|nr:FAD-binding oxidoreductase [Pararhodobacter sp.]